MGLHKRNLQWYILISFLLFPLKFIRGRSRAAATSKMERFVIIVNSVQPLTIITKRSIFNVAAALDPPLILRNTSSVIANHEKKPVIDSSAERSVNEFL